MRQDQRVVVDVDDARLRSHPLGDLVGVVGGGQAGADVEELPDAGLTGQVTHRAGEEGAARLGVLHNGREDLADLVADLAVDGVVVLAAEPVVPDPGAVGGARVQLGSVGHQESPLGGLRSRSDQTGPSA
jgi:hypothetical protein